MTGKQLRVLRISIVLLTILGLVGMVVTMQGNQRIAHAAAPSITGLHVSGNQILNGNNQAIRILGVNRSGTEYMCASGSSIFDGPSDSTSVNAIAGWNANAVRVSLNEDCWLGINGLPAGGTTASQYQQAIVNYVNLLNSTGLIALIDLHWNAPGSTQAKGQQIMADLDHAPAFWTSVANTFKNNTSAIFDLYNEPHPSNWSCWLNGSTSGGASPCSDVSFAVAGMQTLVNTVRNTGAKNILDLGGLAWANDLSQWVQNEPNDPQHNLVAGFHLYNFNSCNNTTCWNNQVNPVAQQVPVITGELGENDCAHGFIDTAMTWMDQHGVSYMGWAWITSSCGGFPSLITSYDGTPTQFGIGLRDHLRSLGGGGTPTPTPTPTQTGSFKFSFEDGGTDGWAGHGNVTNVQNSTTVAHDGTHSLQMTVFSSSSSDFPYVSVAVSGSSAPQAGQTITLFAFLANGSASVSGKLFIQDSQFTWHTANFTSLSQGNWTQLSFTVPAGISVIQLGVQFSATPTNTNGTVSLDSVNWQ